MKCNLLLLIFAFICLANARQIRYSRFTTEVIEDSQENTGNNTISTDNQALEDENEVQATVREIKVAPYPASGFRPSRAFPLPNEAAGQSQTIEESATTESVDLLTTTQGYESETTTIITTTEENLNEDDSDKVEAGEDELSEVEQPKAPYPAAGYQPRIPFLLPTDNLIKNEQQQDEVTSNDATESATEITTDLADEEVVKAPYPAAGYRPSKAFLLPSEQLKLEEETKNDNSKHPVCGSSANPLAPTHLGGEKEDPDSEPVNIDYIIKKQREQRELEEKNKNDNSKHPVCGSSTNPLAPIPLDGGKEDPDSEPVNVEYLLTKQRSQQQRAVVIPVRFTVHPLLLQRPLIYSAPIPAAL